MIEILCAFAFGYVCGMAATAAAAWRFRRLWLEAKT